jgi:hypothetical protein
VCNGGICSQVSAVCLTSYTASVLTIIGSAFIVSQIPGTPISASAPLCTSDLQSSLLQETAVINPAEQTQSQALPPVNVIATSFILASLGSWPSTNDSDSSFGFVCNDTSGTVRFHDQYSVNESYCILYTHGSVWWSQLVSGWMRYMNWQLRESEFRESFALDIHLLNTTTRSQVHTIGHKLYKLDDTANRSGVHTHEVTQNVRALEDSQEWITEIHSCLDQTLLERSSQIKFLPLEMAVSNY